MARRERDTCKYHFKKGRRIIHRGITNDLDRREREHQRRYGLGDIHQVGNRTTREGALKWERNGGKGQRPSGSKNGAGFVWAALGLALIANLQEKRSL